MSAKLDQLLASNPKLLRLEHRVVYDPHTFKPYKAIMIAYDVEQTFQLASTEPEVANEIKKRVLDFIDRYMGTSV